MAEFPSFDEGEEYKSGQELGIGGATPHLLPINPMLEHEVAPLGIKPGGGELPKLPATPAEKPTLHVGEPIKQGVTGGNPWVIYKTASGAPLLFNYNKDFSPDYAQIHQPPLSLPGPDEINFPPHPDLAAKGAGDFLEEKPFIPEGGPSSLKHFASSEMPGGSNYVPGAMPSLHVGLTPDVVTKSEMKFQAPAQPGKEHGNYYYDWDSNGLPKKMSHYYIDPTTGNTEVDEYKPSQIEWPSNPKIAQQAAVPPALYDKLAASAKPWEASSSSSSSYSPESWEYYRDEGLLDAHHAPFTADERAALKRGASTISGRLWKEDLGNLDDARLERMRHLDAAFDKASLPTDLEVHSGVNQDVYDEVRSMKPGELFQHVGYLSTSLSRRTAENFAEGGDADSGMGDGGMIKILAPKGARAIILGPMGPVREENEVQFPRGVMLRKVGEEASGFGSGSRPTIIMSPVRGFGAWHGSSEDFSKFSLDKYNTGAGFSNVVQPDRPGGFPAHYVAGVQKVATKYRDIAQANKGAPGAEGHLYLTHVNAEPEELFNWDKEVRDQLPQVRDALQGIPHPQGPLPENLKGQEVMDYLRQGGLDVREALKSAGLKGIKYLDRRSRQRGYGTSNHALFADDVLNILKHY
jgi:hypothetical protein